MFKPGEIEGIPLGIEQQFSDLEMRIMEDIVRRLKANGNDITRAADWQIHRLHELGMSKREIKKQIQESLQLGDKEIDRIYSDVIKTGYQRDSSIYNFKGKNQIPYEENAGLQQLIAAVSAQTNGEFKNITQTMGFAKRENGQLKFTQLSDYYQKTLDGAMLDITSGAFDYNTVLKRVTKELTNSGLRTVDYASGKSIRVESAARMAVMTGVSQVTAQINESNAKELDTEYFEVTCHGGARPSHQEWQGKVYTKKELGTICGLGAADGLCGCNCYHDYYPFFPGISERAYTDEELKKLKKEENTPVEYNGKSYTKYEATQKQRSLERAMRAQRQQIHLLEQGGANEDDIILARGRYRATSSEYTRFSKAMKLPQQRERVTVDGLGNVGVGKYKISQKSVANSGNGGIIKSNDSNSIYREITQSSIASVPKMNIFNDETLDNAHREASRNLLREVARHKELKVGTEFSIVYDEHMNPISNCGYIQGGMGNVRIDNPNVPYHAFHNHGSGETFSLQDLRGFARRSSMLSLTAQGNTGSKYVISSTKQIDRNGFYKFLTNMSNEVIFRTENQDITLSWLYDKSNKSQLHELFSNLNKEQKRQLKNAIVDKTNECLKGAENYGIKYTKTVVANK